MKIDHSICKLKKIIKYYLSVGQYENTLLAANILANIYYNYNQIYLDSELEDALIQVKKKVLRNEKYDTNKNCVFFYDGFGLDLRGWAVSYIRALSNLDYFVVYACPGTSEGKIPHIISELNQEQSKVIYIDNNYNNIQKAKAIDYIFKAYKPATAFFYTTPYDVSASIAFSNNKSAIRFQVDLTDHAYWIGVNAFDYAIECREMGASLAVYERKINKKRIIKLDCAPYINRENVNLPLPFDVNKERFVFTGGALYKTLGDPELLYYKTISHILDKFSNIKFLYAGDGDDSEIRKLICKYPGRVFYIGERADFFDIIEKSELYINSYPMFGGLMMRYAALAHKIPITLKHNHDSDGILIDQDKLGIEYENYQDYISEIDKLLSDESYRMKKEEKVKNAVISEKEFAHNIKLIIEENRTEFKFTEITKLDTSAFREEYKNRYCISELYKTIGTRKNYVLIRKMPIEYILGRIIRIKEKVFK